MTVKRRACNQGRNTNRILILLSYRRRVYTRSNVVRRNPGKLNVYLRTETTFRVNKKKKEEKRKRHLNRPVAF